MAAAARTKRRSSSSRRWLWLAAGAVLLVVVFVIVRRRSSSSSDAVTFDTSGSPGPNQATGFAGGGGGASGGGGDVGGASGSTTSTSPTDPTQAANDPTQVPPPGLQGSPDEPAQHVDPNQRVNFDPHPLPGVTPGGVSSSTISSTSTAPVIVGYNPQPSNVHRPGPQIE